MKGSTHITGGLLAGALVGVSPVGLAVAGLVALVPDWLQINLPGVNRIVHGIVGHRGFTHCLLTAFAIGAVAWMFTPRWLAVYILLGWVSHLILDLFSGGMTLLWPIQVHVKLSSIKTGGAVDKFLGAWMLAMAGVLIARRLL